MTTDGAGPPGADGLQLIFDTGHVQWIRRAAVIGSAPRPATAEPADLIRIDDPSVAPAHLAFVWDGTHCRVTDLSDRHTTRVELTEHDIVPVHPRSSVIVPPGSLVRFGTRWVRPVRGRAVDGPLPSDG